MSDPAGAVGFLGLGKMGTPMCRRLLAAGYRVFGYDAVPGAVDALAGTDGFTAAESAADLSSRVNTVVLMLPNSDVVDTVVRDGLLGSLPTGSTVIDMSSSVPARTRALAELLAEHGISLVDAPVSGGVAGAVNGTLTVMMGGSDDAVAAVRPLLEVVGGRVEHVGRVGAGHAVKALNNLMSAAHLSASSEALLAARRFGLDVATALRVINNSSGRSGSTEVKWPNFVLSERYDSGFALSLMRKDVGIALDLVTSLGVPAPVSQAVADAWDQADVDMPAGADHTEIVRWLESRSASGSRQNESVAS